jgi:hypothetical protein
MARKKETTVTIEAGGKSATVSPETLAQAADRLGVGKMTTMATIKSVKIDKDGSQILLENCKLSGSQYKKLSGIVAEQTTVDVSISLIRSELPFEEEPAND